jgi:DNA polymerase III delta prime subunit
MFNEELKKRQPVITKFFESAIKSEKLNHAYLLTGSDSFEQYYLALEMARILNCENPSANPSCGCTNCLWIKQNRHPAVITISPVDYTYGNDGSKSSTVISVKQARYLIGSLSASSGYKRVIIFTDALEGKEYEKKAEFLWQNYENIIKPPAKTISEDEERLNWMPGSLKRETFHPAAPNTLLKTLEEPNPNVLFFFLTRDKEDMLDTIVSRCQVLPVLSRNTVNNDLNIIQDLLKSFPPKNYNEAMALSEKLIELSKHENSLEDLLDNMQGYLHQFIKSNSDNKHQTVELITLIEKIEKAKLELNSYVSAQAVTDSLFLSMVNG